MSVNTELQNLLTKMGGSPLESDSNSDLIKKISEAYEGGGGSSGGCKCVVANIIDAGSENEHLDVTAEELWQATQNGTVSIRQPDLDSGLVSFQYLSNANHFDGESEYDFYFDQMASHYMSSNPTGYPVPADGPK